MTGLFANVTYHILAGPKFKAAMPIFLRWPSPGMLFAIKAISNSAIHLRGLVPSKVGYDA